MNKKILEIKKVYKNFQHRNGLIEIFKNINLIIKRGDLVAIVGPSGSGKSTLLNMISLIDTPTSGKIIFNNTDVKDLNEENKNEFRRFIVAVKDIQTNEVFSRKNIDMRRTTQKKSLPPIFFEYILGKKSVKKYLKGESIQL